MADPLTSPERLLVKTTYLGKQKRKRELAMVDCADNPSDLDSNDQEERGSDPVVEATMGDMRPPESRGPKKIDFLLPGPSPKRVRRDSDEIERAKTSPSAVKRSLHSRSSSSISSLSRVVQKATTGSPSSSKKPLSIASSRISGIPAKPSSIRRGATPDTEFDDNASIAESNASVGKIRRTEAERIEYFKNQPDCGTLEPHRTLCTRCDSFVNLGRKQTYTVKPWEKHRIRCDQKPPQIKDENDSHLHNEDGDGSEGDAASTIGPSAGRPERIRRTESERKAILEADNRAEVIKPNEVQCRKCQKVIRLSTKQKYTLNNWTQHQLSCSDTVPSSRVTTATRKLQIVNDSQAKSFTTRNVECAFCAVTVALGGEGDYDLTNWVKHKSDCTEETPSKAGTMEPAVASPSIAEPNSIQNSRPPLSVASTEGTTIASEASPSRQGLKRPREGSEAPLNDPDMRPINRPRTETYEPPKKEAPSPMGWFLLPFKAFVRGFRESLKGDTPA